MGDGHLRSEHGEQAGRPLRWLAIVSGVLGLVFASAAAMPFSAIRGYIDDYAFDGSADPYTPALHQRLQFASAVIGAALLVGAVLGFVAKGRTTQVMGLAIWRCGRDAQSSMKRLTAFLRNEWSWLLAIAIAAAAIRLPWIDQPIRFDEATSWLDYSSQPLVVTVSKYDMPNNHVFHNVCMGLAIRCFGSSLWALRLTAFVAGILTCLLAGCLTFAVTHIVGAPGSTRRFASGLSGLCVAASSVMIEYSTLARGYTLITCFFLICWLAGREAILSRNLFLGCVCVISGALGLWTVPVMLYPLLMATFLILWDPEIRAAKEAADVRASTAGLNSAMARRELYQWLIGGWAAIVGIACVLYVPVFLVSGPGSLSGNSFVKPLEFSEWLDQWPQAAHEGQSLTWRNVPLALRFLWMFGVISVAVRPDRWSARLMLLAAFVVPLIVVPALQRVHPPGRVWLFFIPTLAIFSTWGWCGRLHAISLRGVVVSLQALLLAGLVGWPAFSVLVTDPLKDSWESGQVRQAESACRFLKTELEDAEPIVAVCPASAPLKYYAYRTGINWVHFDWPMTANTRDDQAIVAVSNEGGCRQTVDDVLNALELADEFEGWSREEIWNQEGLALYRLRRPASHRR
jgi:hypothetical protein